MNVILYNCACEWEHVGNDREYRSLVTFYIYAIYQSTEREKKSIVTTDSTGMTNLLFQIY